jgi:hypothetical protein
MRFCPDALQKKLADRKINALHPYMKIVFQVRLVGAQCSISNMHNA